MWLCMVGGQNDLSIKRAERLVLEAWNWKTQYTSFRQGYVKRGSGANHITGIQYFSFHTQSSFFSVLDLLSDMFWVSDEPQHVFLNNSWKWKIYIWVSSVMFLLLSQIWTNTLFWLGLSLILSSDIVSRVSVTQATWD